MLIRYERTFAASMADVLAPDGCWLIAIIDLEAPARRHSTRAKSRDSQK